MYTGLLHTHNLFRWLVLIALVFAIGIAFNGWFKKRNWNKRDNFSGLVLTIFMDIQFFLGIVLYAFVSPIIKSAFNDFGAAMKNPELRFYAVEHILMMVIALIIIHTGRAKSKKLAAPWKKHRAAFIFYTIAFIFILAAVPWERMLI